MLGMRNVVSFYVPGTLTAGLDIRWSAAFDGRIKHISAVASNDSDATLVVGREGDTDEILSAAAIGDSGVPVTFDLDNWELTNETAAFSKGDVLILTLDHDGAAGTAAQDVTLVVTLLEG